MLVHVTDIVWDYDCDESPDLPIDFYIESESDDEEEISDAISDKYGFTHHGFNYNEVVEVTCSVCNNEVNSVAAHLHQGKWIGPCCWDERLKMSE